MSKITVVVMPGTGVNVEVDEGATISDALNKAGFNPESVGEIRLNGETTEDLGTVLSDGDQIVAIQEVEAA